MKVAKHLKSPTLIVESNIQMSATFKLILALLTLIWVGGNRNLAFKTQAGLFPISGFLVNPL